MYGLVLISLSILACNSAPLSTDNDSSCLVFGQLLKPGQRVVQGSFTWECQLGDGGMVRAAIVACNGVSLSTGNDSSCLDGQPLKPGQQVVQLPLRVAIRGCLDDEKKVHPIGDRWDTGNAPFRFVFECSNDGRVTSSRLVQCFFDSPEGQARLDANQEKQVGKDLIKCESDGNGGLKYNIIWGKLNPPSPTNNTIKNVNTNATVSTNTMSMVKPSAQSSSANNPKETTCNIGGKDLKVGNRSQSGSFVYECLWTGTVTIVACVDDNKPQMEHTLGDQWVEGSSPFRYVFQCTKNAGLVIKKVVKCAYVAKDGHETKIEFGKEETLDNLVVQCLQVGVNGAQYHTSFSQAYLASLNANGTGSSKSQK